jgi:hypothetical protein
MPILTCYLIIKGNLSRQAIPFHSRQNTHGFIAINANVVITVARFHNGVEAATAVATAPAAAVTKVADWNASKNDKPNAVK